MKIGRGWELTFSIIGCRAARLRAALKRLKFNGIFMIFYKTYNYFRYKSFSF